MNSYKLIFIGLLFMVLGSACDSKKTTQEDKLTTEDSDGIPTDKKFGIKSGIIHMEVTAAGIKSPEVFYFDDYGNKQCHNVTVTMKMFNKDYVVKTRRIHKDGDIYEIDLSQNTYTKNQTPALNTAGFDLEKLKEEAKNGLKIEKVGTENYLGKECDKYTIANPSIPMNGTMLVYENIPMKANVEAMSIPTELIVTQIEENAAVPDSLFEIPARIKLK